MANNFGRYKEMWLGMPMAPSSRLYLPRPRFCGNVFCPSSPKTSSQKGSRKTACIMKRRNTSDR